MKQSSPDQVRRSFLKSAAVVSSGFAALPLMAFSGHSPLSAPAPVSSPSPIAEAAADSSTIIGPREGYSPQIGTLVSMMDFCRSALISSVKELTTEQLDWLLDSKANSIGALLYHLAATDAFYHEHTFKGVEWGKFDPSVEKKFGTAMELGDAGRKAIKGNPLSFYTGLLEETRASTLAELKKRDDKWLMTVDEKWPWGPTNNYCKWFHVTEHESHHQGQINLLQSRVPGAKKG